MAQELFEEWLQGEVNRHLSKLAPHLLELDASPNSR